MDGTTEPPTDPSADTPTDSPTDPPDGSPTGVPADPPRRAYVLVAAGALSYACLTFAWFALPAYLSTITDDAGLTGTEAGIVAGAVPLTYVPLALFSGVVVDRVGAVRSIGVGAATVGAAQVARSAATGFPSLLVTTLALGVGATAITFGLPKLVSVLFPPARTGFPSSIYLVGASAGSAAAFGVGRPTLGPLLGGWQPLFLWSGVVALAYAAVWLLAARLLAPGAGSGAEQGSEGADATPAPAFAAGEIREDLRTVFAHRELRLVVVVGTMYLLVAHGTQGWFPTVLESRGLSPERAGLITSLLVVGDAVGVLVVPAVADRLGARTTAVTACGVVLSAGLAAVLTGGTGPLVVAGIAAAGFGVGGLAPLVRAIPPALQGVGARRTAVAMGFVFSVGEIGGFLGPVIVGALRDATGSFAPGIAVLAASGIVVMAAGRAMHLDPV